MPFRLQINLGDRDLQHLEQVAQQTQAIARAQSPEQIIAAAREVLERGEQSQNAEFLQERYSRLSRMIRMITDADWRLEGDDRQRVLNALACFAAPNEERTPASVLDHAIMIELVSRDLQHDLSAYRDFVRFRDSYERRHRTADAAARTKALEQRREALQTRMHTRRRRELDRAEGPVRKLFSLFGL